MIYCIFYSYESMNLLTVAVVQVWGVKSRKAWQNPSSCKHIWAQSVRLKLVVLSGMCFHFLSRFLQVSHWRWLSKQLLKACNNFTPLIIFYLPDILINSLLLMSLALWLLAKIREIKIIMMFIVMRMCFKWNILQTLLCMIYCVLLKEMLIN